MINLVYGRNTDVKKMISPHMISTVITNQLVISPSTRNLEAKIKKVSGLKNDMIP